MCRDLKDLQEAVSEFHIAAVSDAFDRLRALINVLVVHVDNIPALVVEEKKIGGCCLFRSPTSELLTYSALCLIAVSFDKEEIECFLRLRSDYNKGRIMRLLNFDAWKPLTQ